MQLDLPTQQKQRSASKFQLWELTNRMYIEKQTNQTVRQELDNNTHKVGEKNRGGEKKNRNDANRNAGKKRKKNRSCRMSLRHVLFEFLCCLFLQQFFFVP